MIFKYFILLCTFVILPKFTNAKINCRNPPRPRGRKLTECCNHILPITDELKDRCLNNIVDGDFDDELQPRPNQPFPAKYNCLYECVINMTGIYSYEKQMLEEHKLEEFLNKGYVYTPEFIPVAKQAFQKCTKKQREAMNAGGGQSYPDNMAVDNHQKCKLFLFSCMKFEVFKNCPDAYWTKSDECRDLHDFINTCPPRTHPKNFQYRVTEN